ncbi:unnamed protein product [Ectocarpus sp. 12 AP-2014]
MLPKAFCWHVVTLLKAWIAVAPGLSSRCFCANWKKVSQFTGSFSDRPNSFQK